MFPAYQTMFINLAEHNQRGTASSSLLVSWDVGVGLGILVGGVVSRYYDYTAAFWCAWVVNMLGVAIFFFLVKKFYETHKLR
jgi:predicted MFS family arabinose efflux permease